MIRLLLHSDHSELHRQLCSATGRDLSLADFRLAKDSSRQRVRDLILRKQCDVVVLDLDCCPASDRFGLLDDMQIMDVPIVVLTGDDSRNTAMELLRRGIPNYCQKPVSIEELRGAVRVACEHAVSKREPMEPVESFGCGELIGSSPVSQAVNDLIRRVADLDAFVLITGESGTGKELIARAIHAQSHRKQKRFVAVSCGAIPEPLIEAELFGCEKGAFTGASARRMGYFEEAGDGTLLLDEIGELSRHTQVKLLRVLQQREFSRLGSSKVIPLAARVVFATNRDLKRMVAEGTFREDLYYRLNVVGVHSRPLRERREEIPQLANHFLVRYARQYRNPATRIDPDALALLTEYAWPGNVRELENTIQSAIVVSDDDTIRVTHLPEEIRQTDLELSSGLQSVNEDLQWSSFERQLHDYKVKLALDAVKGCHGNKTLAAQSLNISRTYLHRLIRDTGDDCPVLKVA